MKINRLFSFIITSLEASLPEHVKMPAGVEPVMAFTSHLSPMGQILAYGLDGREFYIEQQTPNLFPGFRPEGEGVQSFVKGLPFPEEYHSPVIIIPASADLNTKRVFAVFHVKNCLDQMQMWYDRRIVRHYRNGKCVWAGYESQRTPTADHNTIVEKRPVGEREWLQVISKPANSFQALNNFKLSSVEKQKEPEQWSPSSDAEASVGEGGVIPIESGKKPKQKEKVPRSKKVAER